MKTDALATLLPATKLAPILKRHTPAEMPAPPLDPIATLVSSFLLWESSTTAADQALVRLKAECVDFNELRVCLPEEIVSMLGSRYPFADERANRLRRALNDIYRREHKVSLDHIAAMGKREQRTYIENLDGMVPYVAARMLLLHFGTAGVPVDDQLVELFRDQKLVPVTTTAVELAHTLGKHYHSLEESMKAHVALIGFADAAWEKDPKAMMKNKSARMAAQQAAERAARREAEKAAEAAAKAAEAAAKAEAERIEAAKVAARAQARADARARAAAVKAQQQQAAAAAAAAAAKNKPAVPAAPAKGAKVVGKDKAASKVPPPAAAKVVAKAPVKGAAKPAIKTTPKPTLKPTPKPAPKPIAKGAVSGSAKPMSKAGKPAAKPASKSNAKPAPKPAAKPAPKPTSKPAPKPTAKPAPKPMPKPMPKKGSKK